MSLVNLKLNHEKTNWVWKGAILSDLDIMVTSNILK